MSAKKCAAQGRESESELTCEAGGFADIRDFAWVRRFLPVSFRGVL